MATYIYLTSPDSNVTNELINVDNIVRIINEADGNGSILYPIGGKFDSITVKESKEAIKQKINSELQKLKDV